MGTAVRGDLGREGCNVEAAARRAGAAGGLSGGRLSRAAGHRALVHVRRSGRVQRGAGGRAGSVTVIAKSVRDEAIQ